jgi:hypothetical protein
MKISKPIKECRICGNTNLVKVLDLGEHILTGVFPKKKEEVITQGPLQLVKCHGEALEQFCGLLQLAHSYDLNEMYGDNYGYRSSLNESMVVHLKKKVLIIMKKVELFDGDLVIDIGSNDSTTLRAYTNHKCQLVGVDPTGKKFSKYYPSHIKLIPEFFSIDLIRNHFGEKKAKVITSFSMFYDLPKPMEFMTQVRDVLAVDGIWVFEQSYMPTMLNNNSFDTVCHEHLEYYGLHQIKWMTDKLNLRIIDVEFNDVNGGSFSVTVAHDKSKYQTFPFLSQLLKKEIEKSLNTLEPYIKFSERVEKARIHLVNFLKKANAKGKKVGALGASTKGNVILQYCGITEKEISFVGDLNPDKFGCFTPGTLLPIISEELALERRPDYLIVLPWHFKNFFTKNKKFNNFQLVFPLPYLEIQFSNEK